MPILTVIIALTDCLSVFLFSLSLLITGWQCCYNNSCLCSAGKSIGEIADKSGDGRVSPKGGHYAKDEQWVEMKDANTGQTYYLNKTTGKTQWEAPN
jgi:hypothetical protein